MSVPRRVLPANPDLAQQKKLAKELLADFRRGDRDAGARVRAQLPDKGKIGLADAQFVLAREYGLRDWRELRKRIDAIAAERLTPAQRLEKALHDEDVTAVRRLLQEHEELRASINKPLYEFNSPALVSV